MKNECVSCRMPRAQHDCELCGEPVCRSCEQILGEDVFSCLPKLPPELSHTRYCGRCYDSQVAPEIEKYQELFEKAQTVDYVPKTFRGRIQVLEKAKERVSVSGCKDRQEATMKLAFLAVMQGFSAIIQGELECEKVRNHGYQTSRWSGSGLPANIADTPENMG